MLAAEITKTKTQKSRVSIFVAIALILSSRPQLATNPLNTINTKHQGASMYKPSKMREIGG